MVNIIYLLWLVSSTYSSNLGVFPDSKSCEMAVGLYAEKLAGVVDGRLICVPSIAPARPAATPGRST